MTYSVYPAPAGLFLPNAMLDALGVGLIQLVPGYAPNDPATLLTLSYLGASAVAQRLLELPDQPAGLFGTAGAQETALFAFCRATFWSGEAGYFAPEYVAADGSRWRVAAQRSEAQLVVSFSEIQEPDEKLRATNEELRASNEQLVHAHGQLQQLNHKLAADAHAARLACADAERQCHRLERLVEQSPAAISILGGPELVYELVNPEYQALFPGQPLHGLSLQAAHPQAADPSIAARLHEVYETGVNYTGRERPWQVPRPGDGQLETRYLDYIYQARYDEHGVVDGVLIFALDVTAQVLARAQLQRFNEELEARVQDRTREVEAARAEAETRRQQLAAIVEQAPVAITYVTGPEVRVVAINPAACHQLGCSPPDVLNRPLLESFPYLQHFADLLREVMRTQVPVRSYEAEAQLERDGQLVTTYFDLSYQPLVNEVGQPMGVLSTATEVTEQVLARRRAQQLNVELEARVKAGIQEAYTARADAERRRERLERFFAQAPAAICVLDGPTLVFELVNPRFQNIFPGRPLLGMPLLEALPEFRDQRVWQEMQRVYATGETHEEPSGLIKLAQYSGGPLADFYFHYVQQARYDAQGHIDGMLVFALDLTAQVRVRQRAERLQEEILAAAQRRAQEREAFYQIFAQTPAVIALLRGPDHRFEYVNQAYEALYPGRPLRGLPLLEALPETGPQGFAALLDQVYQTGETYVGTEVRHTVTAPDGSPVTTKWMSFTYQAYRENGTIMGVSVFAYDVTAQVRARQQREAGLAQLHAIFEQAPVGIALLMGTEYVVEVANPAVCEMWGRKRALVLGHPLLTVLPEVVNQGIPELLGEVYRTGQPFVTEELPVQLHRHGRQETVYFQFVYQPLTNAEGQVMGIAIVATDVSVRVLNRQQLAQANEELRTTNAQLMRTNTDLDNFIYTASHDLKAPIANIEGLLLLLRKQLPTAAQQVGLVPRVLGMMQESVERFQLTIAQLTDLTRLQQVHAEPAQVVELAAIVEAVRLDLAPMLEATSTQLVVDIQACAAVQFAPQHLRSIIYNLLSNAIKYRHPNRVPQVQLRCHSTESSIVLEVQDNGLGLSEQQQRKLFTLFQRLHAHVEGSGVGLYMVKRIVENAGGTLTVHSEVGVGSTFTVALPAHAQAALP